MLLTNIKKMKTRKRGGKKVKTMRTELGKKELRRKGVGKIELVMNMRKTEHVLKINITEKEIIMMTRSGILIDMKARRGNMKSKI